MGQQGGGDAARALIGSPLSASRDSTGARTTGGAGDADGGASGGGLTGGGLPPGVGGGPQDATGAGTASDTPIVVLGNPYGIIPGPSCGYAFGTTAYFDGIQVVLTGNKDTLKRDIFLVKGMFYSQLGTNPPRGPQGKFIDFFNGEDSSHDPLKIGGTATWDGCFFAEIHAPESAMGTVIRLKASIPVCGPGVEVLPSHSGGFGEFKAMMAKKDGGDSPSEPLITGHGSSPEADYDLTLPAHTDATTLDRCSSEPDWSKNPSLPGFPVFNDQAGTSDQKYSR